MSEGRGFTKVYSLFMDIVSGDVIIRNRKIRQAFPVMLYSCLLILTFIGYVFYCHYSQSQQIAEKTRMMEEKSRAMVYQSLRMNASRHSSISKQISERGIGLEESTTPPKSITR